MLALDSVIRFQEVSTQRPKRAVHNLKQSRSLNSVFSCIPAAMCIPIVHTLQENFERDLVVIGNREAAGRCGIETRQNHRIRIFQLMIAPKAQQRTLQLVPLGLRAASSSLLRIARIGLGVVLPSGFQHRKMRFPASSRTPCSEASQRMALCAFCEAS